MILIIGRRRFGKSALGFYILEKFHNEQPNLKIFIVHFPKTNLLPEWITPVDDVEELPDNCIALIDEGAMRYHAHKWHKQETQIMDTMISISGQKHQTFIFITHTMRKFAVTLLLDINMLLVKKPSLLHSKLERSEFRKLIEKIDNNFNKLPKEDIKRSVYVVSEEYEGFITNPLPSFWSEDISEAYSGITLKKEETKQEETIVKPYRIESGLKLWFKKTDIKKVLEILSKNSTINGELSELGVQCAGGNCFYSWDLKKGLDQRYYLVNDRFDIEQTIKDLTEQKMCFVVDIESAFPLNNEDVVFWSEKKEIGTKTTSSSENTQILEDFGSNLWKEDKDKDEDKN